MDRIRDAVDGALGGLGERGEAAAGDLVGHGEAALGEATSQGEGLAGDLLNAAPAPLEGLLDRVVGEAPGDGGGVVEGVGDLFRKATGG